MRAMQGHASLAVHDWLERTIVGGNKPGASVFDIISIIHSPTNRVGNTNDVTEGKSLLRLFFVYKQREVRRCIEICQK